MTVLVYTTPYISNPMAVIIFVFVRFVCKYQEKCIVWNRFVSITHVINYLLADFKDSRLRDHRQGNLKMAKFDRVLSPVPLNV